MVMEGWPVLPLICAPWLPLDGETLFANF